MLTKYGAQHLELHRREVDALDLFELPDECPKCCPKCQSRRVRIVWNHRNTNSDFAYCAECNDRPSVGYIPKRFTGAPSTRKRGNVVATSDWVFERDKWRCQECGKSPIEDGVKLEVAHIMSVADAKRDNATEDEYNHESNLFASCWKCNNERGDLSLPPLFILRLIRARIRRGQR